MDRQLLCELERHRACRWRNGYRSETQLSGSSLQFVSRHTSRCPVTKGEVDLESYAKRDGEWRKIGLAAPARRALVDAGLTELIHLKKFKREQIDALHGMGPSALKTLDAAMKKLGMAFKQG